LPAPTTVFRGRLWDIDMVIAAKPDQIRAFVDSLPASEYYADLDAALEAHKRESLFNVIDLASGWKIDLIIRKSRAFSQEEFGAAKWSPCKACLFSSPALRT
jgi:hypothetical protein